jgi:hypothetical protein
MDRGPADHDLTHIFTGSFVLPLPFGEGKRFSTGSSVVNHVIGNWELNGIVSLNTGPRYSIFTDNSISNIQNFNGVELANRVGNPYAAGGGFTPNKLNPISPAAFVNPDTGTFGNSGRNAL